MEEPAVRAFDKGFEPKQKPGLAGQLDRGMHFDRGKPMDAFGFPAALRKGRVRMTMDTPRLVIRMASEEEMEAIVEQEADDELRGAYREMLQGCRDHPDQVPWYAVWLIERKDGTCVGDLCFKGLNDDGSVEIGYGIDEGFRSMGFATEAVAAAVAWALAQPNVSRVEAETVPDNHASQRVLEKSGFVPSGIEGEEGPRYVFVPQGQRKPFLAKDG